MDTTLARVCVRVRVRVRVRAASQERREIYRYDAMQSDVTRKERRAYEMRPDSTRSHCNYKKRVVNMAKVRFQALGTRQPRARGAPSLTIRDDV